MVIKRHNHHHTIIMNTIIITAIVIVDNITAAIIEISDVKIALNIDIIAVKIIIKNIINIKSIKIFN